MREITDKGYREWLLSCVLTPEDREKIENASDEEIKEWNQLDKEKDIKREFRTINERMDILIKLMFALLCYSTILQLIILLMQLKQ